MTISTANKDAQGLAGRHVVITRPLAQAGHLAEMLADRGAIPVRFPVLSIFDVDDKRPLLDAAIQLENYDLVIFISPNAVIKALDVMLQHRTWPQTLQAVTMGHSSERELTQRGVRKIISPQIRFDSEALLEMPELQQVKGRKVLICRGDGGRELLGDTLIERGATVEYLTVYHRGKPTQDPTPLFNLWEAGQLDAVTLTSSEGLRNMIDMIGHLGHAWLKNTPTFVPHARIAEQAEAFGLRHIISTGPGDEGLIHGLISHFNTDGNARRIA